MSPRLLRWLTLLCLSNAGVVAQAQNSPETGQAAYLSSRAPADTLHRPADALHTAGTSEAIIPGYLSSRGLPPTQGQFRFDGSVLVFQSADVSGPLDNWEPTAVALAYVVEEGSKRHYVFRVDAGVFETDVPGPMLALAGRHRARPTSRDRLSLAEEHPLADAADSAALWRTAREIAASAYADSLYSLFGRPKAAVGLIGARGRSAGRLGEYIASRDSLSLDPGHITGWAQLRHALAHELAHRWQRRARTQLARLWAGVSPIRDPKRYGYGDRSEHQAEAIAFAVSFLQATASGMEPEAGSVRLLEHYDLLVPGTRAMVRYLILQPLYWNHPLRNLLTVERARPFSQTRSASPSL